jgi:hypothetical protein
LIAPRSRQSVPCPHQASFERVTALTGRNIGCATDSQHWELVLPWQRQPTACCHTSICGRQKLLSEAGGSRHANACGRAAGPHRRLWRADEVAPALLPRSPAAEAPTRSLSPASLAFTIHMLIGGLQPPDSSPRRSSCAPRGAIRSARALQTSICSAMGKLSSSMMQFASDQVPQINQKTEGCVPSFAGSPHRHRRPRPPAALDQQAAYRVFVT